MNLAVLPFVQEWLNLLVRWTHVIAGIMWVGDSFLFMWLDKSLEKPKSSREGDVIGEVWLTHGGGFYEMVKRRTLAREAIPDTLHWFKWESYSTWISGFLLLIIVYWMGGATMLIDKSVRDLSQGQAIGISVGSLVLAVVVYDLLCRTPLESKPKVLTAIGLVGVMASAWALSLVFPARAAFLHVGAMLGTIMSSNVFFRIIPSQRAMMAATIAGTPVNTSLGARAKLRSTHNHHLSLPVIFCMVSGHFPRMYAHPMPWLILGLVTAFGIGVKIAMNHRTRTALPVALGTACALVAAIALTLPREGPAQPGATHARIAPHQALSVVLSRCAPCHAAQPTQPGILEAPKGMVLESIDDLHRHAAFIRTQSVDSKIMPLGNLTQMTDEERALLGAYLAQSGGKR